MCSYESIKSSIRLLLTSASNGLSLEQLNHDYQYYNQSRNIPYQNFGYSSLLNFLSDMPDVAQFDFNSSSSLPIVYGIQSNHRTKCQPRSIEVNENTQLKVSILNTRNISFDKINTRSSKTIKRLVLKNLPTNNRQSNSSTEHVIDQLTNLTMNQKYLLKNVSENFPSHKMISLQINSTNQCQIIHYSNGKYYIPCFELSRLLNLHEHLIDQETMFSRIRIYPSNDIFHLFEEMNNSCQHHNNRYRPYFFLFLISSIIPLLKIKTNIYQHDELVRALEQLL